MPSEFERIDQAISTQVRRDIATARRPPATRQPPTRSASTTRGGMLQRPPRRPGNQGARDEMNTQGAGQPTTYNLTTATATTTTFATATTTAFTTVTTTAFATATNEANEQPKEASNKRRKIDGT